MSVSRVEIINSFQQTGRRISPPLKEVVVSPTLIEGSSEIITSRKSFNNTQLLALRHLGTRQIAEQIQQVITGPYGSLIGPIGKVRAFKESANPISVVGAGVNLIDENGAVDLYIQAIVANIAAGIGHVITNTWSVSKIEDIELFEEVMKEHLRIVNIVKTILFSKAKTWVTLGPKGESYVYDTKRLAEKYPEKAAKLAPTPTFDEALNFWIQRLAVLRDIGGLDTIMAETFPNVDEAKAIVLAAKEVQVPIRVSFVVDAVGNLLNGLSIAEAIKEIDAATGGYAEGFAFNCCPLSGVCAALNKAEVQGVLNRVLGFHINSTDKDASELIGLNFGAQSVNLIEKNADLFARSRVVAAIAKFYGLQYCGGCCGFTPEHTKHIAEQFT